MRRSWFKINKIVAILIDVQTVVTKIMKSTLFSAEDRDLVRL